MYIFCLLKKKIRPTGTDCNVTSACAYFDTKLFLEWFWCSKARQWSTSAFFSFWCAYRRTFCIIKYFCILIYIPSIEKDVTNRIADPIVLVDTANIVTYSFNSSNSMNLSLVENPVLTLSIPWKNYVCDKFNQTLFFNYQVLFYSFVCHPVLNFLVTITSLLKRLMNRLNKSKISSWEFS